MIAYLSGKVIDVNLDSIILDITGVGYRVFILSKLSQEIKTGKETSLWIHHAVREDSEKLYGFKEKTELEMFELLMTISGIGPKSALSILNAATVETLNEGIRSSDAAYLSKISGISRKNSEKIIVGLKDKIGVDISGETGVQNQNTVAIDALVALGYSERESREVVRKIGKADNPEEIIKKALKKLSS